jgi:hypothetical protein
MPVIPAMRKEREKNCSLKLPRQKHEILSGKQTKKQRTGNVARVVEHWPSKHRALSQSPVPKINK